MFVYGYYFHSFKSSGKWPSLNDLLKIITKPLIISCFTCFSNDTLISIVALFLSWFISLRTEVYYLLVIRISFHLLGSAK